MASVFKIKNMVVVIAFSFLKHNRLCGRLANLDYFYT